MKKITNFIVDKRYFILTIFIIFTVFALFLSDNVKINYDIARYLPSKSLTRIGMDIMEEEFENVEESTLNVMFDNLKDEEKLNVKKELENISGVKNVDYDNSSDYNKDNHTLYVITVDDKADSKVAGTVYNTIKEKYKDYKIFTSGNVDDSNKTVLPFSIIALAVFSALIILLIMCESFVEPFLFLITILMAVVLNKGTNIIFSDVSHITNSICSILQMALSMDYSIMLMNRYDQEKKNEKDKVKAMKEALHKSFQSISSSSITTIVGLLALVFMSFKIGKDLGIILAKGVLFSLICIFFVLPSLILMFDKWIVKTKKKTPHIKTDLLGKLSYKFRFISIPLFLIILISSFMLKGNLGIDYTDKQSDEIEKVFEENNQIAIIYKNDYEEEISKYLEQLENKKNIKKVLGYGNTINQKLTYNEVNDKLKELGEDKQIEDYLLKIVYYDYYNNQNNKVTFDEFIKFIQEYAYNNKDLNDEIDDDIKKDITRLKNFVNESNINKKITLSEIATLLEIDESKVKDIIIYYLSKNNNDVLSLDEFINFMNCDVLTSKEFSNKINEDVKSRLNTLSKFINKENIQKKLTKDDMSRFFMMDKNTVDNLFKYYILKNNTDTKLTINEFSNFVLNYVLTLDKYSNLFDYETINNMKLLKDFSDKELINKKMNSSELSHFFGIDENLIKQVLLFKYIESENNNKYTIEEFINYVTVLREQTNYLDDIDLNALEELKNTDLIYDKHEYSNIEMSNLLNVDIKEINKIYNLIYSLGNTDEWVITNLEFVELILNNFQDKIDNTVTQKLNLLYVIMNSSINDETFTYQELSTITSVDSNKVKNIYDLYITSKDITLTPVEFVSFILDNQNDSVLSNSISDTTKNELNLVYTVMNDTLNNKKYSSESLSSLLGIDIENMDLLYGLHNFIYVNKDFNISLNNFINFVINDVINNKEYSSNFDSDKVLKLNTVNNIMRNSINNKKYDKDEMFSIISKLSNNVEKNTVDVLYVYYGSVNNYNNKWELTLEEFINYLNNKILLDDKFKDFIKDDMKSDITESKTTIKDAKELLVSKNYSRIVLNTNFDKEDKETFDFIKDLKDTLSKDIKDFYVIGDSPMAYEISNTFDNELNSITIITMIAIFIVVAITFKSLIIPVILVLIIQCAVYLTMGILSITGENVYFIAILIVQSILMGATIDYAILYTSYYLENRKKFGIMESVKESYKKSIHAILTSSSILIIVTLIIASFTSAIASKICKTISEGTICSTILILVLLPSILAVCDKLITKRLNKMD